jgi:adenylate cyclase
MRQTVGRSICTQRETLLIAAQPADQRIEFRIGINLGDIIIDGEDIYGDGVNVAARLEGERQPTTMFKIGLIFEDLGDRQLKNIARPVHVFRIALGVDQPPTSAKPALTLPDKPSIAVLPFQNMSGDPEQEYFADGITEDIITALSKLRGFFDRTQFNLCLQGKSA